jgi:hypothetical protein
MMIDLRQALESGNLEQFIAEHEGETGDREALEATLRSMAGRSKQAPEASSPGDGGD